jgi:zeta-carotene desaturase
MAEEPTDQREDCSATIVGAGIAGLSAALRLLEAGFNVTVLERTDTVGGKFGALNVADTYHEHAYHFLADWCLNFWNIAGAIGLSKNEHFVRRDAIKFLRRKPETGHVKGCYEFVELKHGGSLLNFWDNVHSGVIPPDDMIAYAYSLLDLVTEGRDDPDELEFLNRISVNGFMRSRTYMTELASLLHQEALLKAFAVPSYETSVRSYRTFIRFFGRDAGGWILKGDCHTTFWKRFLERLRSYRGQDGRPRFELCLETSPERLEVEHDRPDRCTGPEWIPRVTRMLVRGRGREEWIRPKHLILAVPYSEVVRLVEKNELLRTHLPDLLELRKLRSRQMASLDLYFKDPLPGIPPEHVTLIDDSHWDQRTALAYDGDIASNYGLSFVDNYQAWNGEQPPRETWLNVVAADFEEMAGLPEDVARDAIIEELRAYLDFEWTAVDWDRSHFRLNDDAPLFANTVGSWQFRPETRTDRPEYKARWVHSRVKNLYLAGDYCRSKIDLVCLEGAVTTGIAAARAVAGDDKVPAPLTPPEVSAHECESAKAALAPGLALTAKGRAL